MKKQKMMKKKEKHEIVKPEPKRELVSIADDITSSIILNGDLSKLSPIQKVQYYNAYCSRIGLDPVTKPFDLIKLNGREVLYATRACAQQLNKLHRVSHSVLSREILAESYYVVTCRASLPDGRYTDSIGAVNIKGLSGDMYVNALMKAETKSKRRATLDLLGLGILDESEAETIPGAKFATPQENPVNVNGGKTEKTTNTAPEKPQTQKQEPLPVTEPTKNEIEDLRGKIRGMILDIVEGSTEFAYSYLEEITSFQNAEGKTINGKKNVIDLSDKAVPVVFRKVKERWMVWRQSDIVKANPRMASWDVDGNGHLINWPNK